MRPPRRDFKPPEPKVRINEFIRVPQVRLVGDNLEEVSAVAGQPVAPGIYDTRRVLQWARQLELDLVEISPNAEPPVVKITDFRKFLYDKKKKEKELKAKAVKIVVKEIRFGPNTDEHDFEFKVRHAKNFLEEGAKVKAYIQFRGRSIVYADRGENVLVRMIEELADYGVPEAPPKLEGKRMFLILTPKKKK